MASGYCAKQTRENTNLLSKWADLETIEFDSDKKYASINTTNYRPIVTLIYKDIPIDLLEIFKTRKNYIQYHYSGINGYLFEFSIIDPYIKEWSRLCKIKKMI